jgi:hypothetical protein
MLSAIRLRGPHRVPLRLTDAMCVVAPPARLLTRAFWGVVPRTAANHTPRLAVFRLASAKEAQRAATIHLLPFSRCKLPSPRSFPRLQLVLDSLHDLLCVVCSVGSRRTSAARSIHRLRPLRSSWQLAELVRLARALPASPRRSRSHHCVGTHLRPLHIHSFVRDARSD